MKNILGAATMAVGVGVAMPAAAVPVTYTIDQAFWGAFSVPLSPVGPQTPAEFQDARATDVASDPGAFGFLTGQVTVDWDTDTVLDLALTMTAPGGYSALFGMADIATLVHANAGSRFTNLALPVEEFRFGLAAFDGPDQTFLNDGGPDEVLPQFRSLLDFTLTRVVTDGSLNMTLANGQFGEAVQATLALPDPSCNIFVPESCTGNLVNAGGTYSVDAILPYTETYGAAGISVAAVPLPAAGWLLLAGLGALGLRKRR